MKPRFLMNTAKIKDFISELSGQSLV